LAGTVIEELAVKLGLNVEEGEFLKAFGLIEGLHKGFEQLWEKVIEIGKEAISELKNLAPETAAYANEARKAAIRTGTTTEAFQELGFAAKASGVDVATLETSLGIMSRVAFGAAEGGEEMEKTLHKLGIQVKDSDGKIRPTDELLGDFAEKFAELPEGIERNALAMKVFGRGGRELLPLLAKGKEGIAELRAEAHEFGLVLDKDAIANAKRFAKANRELDESIEGVKFGIGAELLKTADAWKQTLADLIRENRVLIVTLLKLPIRALMAAFKLIGWVIDAFLIQPFRDMNALLSGDVTRGLLGMAEVAGLVGIAFTLAGAEAVAAWVAMLWPILAVVAGIAVLLLWLEDVQTFFEGGDSMTGDFVNALMDGFDTIPPYLKELFGEFWDWLVNKAKEIGGKVKDFLVENLMKFPAALKAALQSFPGIGRLFGTDTLPQPIGGGGASPQASAATAAQKNTTNQNGGNSHHTEVNVTVPPGTNPHATGQAVADAVRDEHERELREAHVGVQQ
jgi:TP901 family phage tail tape measure protein